MPGSFAGEYGLLGPHFSVGIRGCGQVDDRLRAQLHQFIQWTDPVQAAPGKFSLEGLFVPQVLADGDCQLRALEFQQTEIPVGFKVAVLVKDVIGGKQRFAKGLPDFTTLQKEDTVEKEFSFRCVIVFRTSGQDPHIRMDAPCQLFHCLPASVNEILSFQEIQRRVSANGQFREEYEMRPFPGSPFHGMYHFIDISAEIADEDAAAAPAEEEQALPTSGAVLPDHSSPAPLILAGLVLVTLVGAGATGSLLKQK